MEGGGGEGEGLVVWEVVEWSVREEPRGKGEK